LTHATPQEAGEKYIEQEKWGRGAEEYTGKIIFKYMFYTLYWKSYNLASSLGI